MPLATPTPRCTVAVCRGPRLGRPLVEVNTLQANSGEPAVCAAARGLSSFFFLLLRAGDEGDDGERRSPVQRERLVDLAAERVRTLRQLERSPERVLDQ